MTTTTPQTRTTTGHTDAAAGTPAGLPRVRARRNPLLLATGAALVVTGSAGVAWLVTSVADASPVLVTTHAIAAGQLIDAADLAVAQVSLDPAVAVVPADQRAAIVGQRAATALPAGQLLTPASVTDAPVPGPGLSLVGVAVTPAQLPAAGLAVGDPVTLVAAARDGDELPTSQSPSMPGTVAGSRLLDDGTSVVDVTVPTARAGQLATWVSTGRVVIVRDPAVDPMTVLILGSVTGAPGVTTTAVALTAGWPRPVVLVEAAPAGASAVLPGFLGGRVPHSHGIVDAAVAARAGTLTDDLPGLLIDLPGAPHARLLAGLTRPEQAATMSTAWPVLADALIDASRALGVELIVDAGRMGGVGAALPALPTADRVLLVTGSALPALHTARAWLPMLRAQLVDSTRLQLLVVGEGNPYPAREIRRHLGVPVAGVIDHDPAGAAVWSHGAPSPRRPGAFERSIAALLPTLAPPTIEMVGGVPR